MATSEILINRTKGFIAEIEPYHQEIIDEALRRINPQTDLIVFDPNATEERVEDEGRTLRLPSKAKKKVYVKLEDFGSKEALSENVGFTVNTQYAVTFMLAEEY